MLFKKQLKQIEDKVVSAINTVRDMDKAMDALKKATEKNALSIEEFMKSTSSRSKDKHPIKIENIVVGEDVIEINQPSISELIEWGKKYELESCEKEYFTGLGYIVATPYHFASALEDINIDFEETSSFDLFYIMINSNPELFKRVLEITLKINNKTMSNFALCMNNTDKSIVIYDTENEIGITKKIYEKLFEFVIKTYGFEDYRNKKFESKEAKKFYISHQRLKSFKEKDKEYKKYLPWLVGENIKSIENLEDLSDVLDIPIGEYFAKYREGRKSELKC